MASADKTIQIGFVTTADTSGAEAAEQAVNRLTAEEIAYNERKAMFLTAAEREVAEVDRLVRASQRLQEEKRSENVVLDETNKKTKVSGQFINDLGYQVQDFSVQVAGGTSVLRSASQQAPQILSAFTQYGVISGKMSLAFGAAAAAIPLLVFGLGKLGDVMSGSKEEIEKAAEAYGKLTEKIEKQETDKITALNLSLHLTNTALTDQITAFRSSEDAATKYAASAVSDAEKIAEANKSINAVLGIQVDRIREIEEAEKRKSAERAQHQQEAFLNLKKQEAEALKAAQEATNAYNEAVDKYNKLQAVLATTKERRITIEDRLAQAKAIVDDGAGLQRDYTKTENPLTEESRLKLEQARDILSDRAKKFDDEAIAKLKDSEAKLKTELDRLGEVNDPEKSGEIAKLEAAMKKADNVLWDIDSAVRTAFEALQKTANADEIKAAAQQVEEKNKAIADNMAEIFSHFQPLTEAGRKVSDDAANITRDHLITLGEIPKTLDIIRNATVMLASGLAGTNDNQSLSTQILAALQRKVLKLESDLKAMKQANPN
jgi:hypothetical protein